MKTTVIKWIVFFTMSVTVPVIWYMFFAAGLLPLAAVFLMTFTISGTGAWVLIFINVVHLVVYVPALYLIALEISHRLRKFSPAQRNARLLGILALLLLLAGLPIYGAGHSIEWKNAYRFYLDYHAWLM